MKRIAILTLLFWLNSSFAVTKNEAEKVVKLFIGSIKDNIQENSKHIDQQKVKLALECLNSTEFEKSIIAYIEKYFTSIEHDINVDSAIGLYMYSVLDGYILKGSTIPSKL